MGAQRGGFNVSFMDVAGVRWGARGRSGGGAGGGAWGGGGVAAERQPALAESQKKFFPSVIAVNDRYCTGCVSVNGCVNDNSAVPQMNNIQCRKVK